MAKPSTTIMPPKPATEADQIHMDGTQTSESTRYPMNFRGDVLYSPAAISLLRRSTSLPSRPATSPPMVPATPSRAIRMPPPCSVSGLVPLKP